MNREKVVKLLENIAIDTTVRYKWFTHYAILRIVEK
jgi:hypothetical protein